MKWRFIYRGLKARFRDQRQEIQALLAGLQPDQWAIDVGANKGSYLWSLSRAVPRGRVVAFEPQPVLARYLDEACRSAGMDNVQVEGAGCSLRSGHQQLAIPGGGESSPGASFEAAVAQRESCNYVTVPTHSLDDYFRENAAPIGAIKIDVEGHELSVLRGAERLLRMHRPTVVCECEQRHISQGRVQDVIDFMSSLGYQGMFLHRKKWIDAADFDPAIHQRQEGDRFWDAPDYCNNFLFVPA
jgi:FkbM family methyltransferase